MRAKILMGLVIAFQVTGFSSEARASTLDRQVRRVRLERPQISRLAAINDWLNENIRESDCPEKYYFGVFERSNDPELLGYEVVAECPDAPTPRMFVRFDADQRYLDSSSD